MLELLLTLTNQRKTSSLMKKQIHENERNIEKGDEKKEIV